MNPEGGSKHPGSILDNSVNTPIKIPDINMKKEKISTRDKEREMKKK